MKKHLVLCSAVVGVLAGVNGFAAEGWHVGAFVDPQFQWNSVATTFNTTGGFKLGDAALRVGHEDKDSSAELDLAPIVTAGFTNPTTGVTYLQAGLVNFKGQAYVAHKYSMGVSWKLGVFDTPFGMESNWSDQAWAATTGQVYSLLPASFVGAMVSYSSGAFTASILGANTRGTTIWGTTSPDLGIQLKYGTEGLNAKVGFLYNSAAASGYLIDVGVGFKSGSFKGEVGFDMTNPATVSKMGIFVQPTFMFTDMVGAGLRAEYVVPSTGASIIQATIGPDFVMSKALKVRPQYTFTSSSPASTTTHSAVLSAVYSM